MSFRTAWAMVYKKKVPCVRLTGFLTLSQLVTGQMQAVPRWIRPWVKWLPNTKADLNLKAKTWKCDCSCRGIWGFPMSVVSTTQFVLDTELSLLSGTLNSDQIRVRGDFRFLRCRFSFSSNNKNCVQKQLEIRSFMLGFCEDYS